MNNEIRKSVDIVLKHYGVKGMKWGVRKGNKNNLSKMSDDELRQRINRLNMEKQYRKLTKKKMSKGKKAVLNGMKHVGERAAKRYANAKVDEMVDELVDN